MTRKKIIQMVAGLVLVLVLGVGGILRSFTITNPSHWGETMGTGYSVKITGRIKQKDLKQLANRIDAELAEINRQMSTWDPESEISRFNHSGSTEPFKCSEAFAMVVQRSLELAESTDGAFDPTLQPLLNLWGFGSEAEARQVPTAADISKARKATGWDKIEREGSSSLWKTEPALSLALGAIAKGYGVDVLANIMNEAGVENWFVEIGGEVVVKGVNPDGLPWKVGIQYPTTNPMDGRLQGIVNLTNGAVATSGDYHNYIEEDGTIYSHILDPRSGRTIRSGTASVTVVAPSCMDADGMATALFVMGAADGLAWVELRPDIEALFLLRGDDGEISEKISSGFIEAAGYNQSLSSRKE